MQHDHVQVCTGAHTEAYKRRQMRLCAHTATNTCTCGRVYTYEPVHFTESVCTHVPFGRPLRVSVLSDMRAHAQAPSVHDVASTTVPPSVGESTHESTFVLVLAYRGLQQISAWSHRF